jgi:chemotaxis signal transduction protein
MRINGENSFVLFPLGSKRFALPAETVSELAIPDRLQTFPHSSRLMAGVLVRRGRIVPVCDVAQVLIGPAAPPRKFYLIANRRLGPRSQRTAIPVTGECELANLDPVAPTQKMPPYVRGVLTIGSEVIEIVDLEKLISMEVAA